MKKFALALVAIAALLSVLPTEAADTVLESVGITQVERNLDELETRCQVLSEDQETEEFLSGR